MRRAGLSASAELLVLYEIDVPLTCANAETDVPLA